MGKCSDLLCLYIQFSINVYLEVYETLAKQHGRRVKLLTQKRFPTKGLVTSK